jgi:hypothetical protein
MSKENEERGYGATTTKKKKKKKCEIRRGDMNCISECVESCDTDHQKGSRRGFFISLLHEQQRQTKARKCYMEGG